MVDHDKILLSEEHRKRLFKVIPMAQELMANNGPEEVFEKIKSMEPEDAYIVGMVIGRNLHNLRNKFNVFEKLKLS